MPQTRKVSCKRNQKGGNLGGGWGFITNGSPSAALGPTVNNAMITDSIGNCRAAVPTGYLENGYTGPKGLPGLSLGGGRGSRKGKGRKGKGRKGKGKGRKSSKKTKRNARRVQSGGRYGMGPYDGAGMGTPWGSGIPPTMRVPCEASYTAIPPNGASDNLNRVGGPLWDGPKTPLGMMGGGSPAIADASASQSVMNPNSEWYIAPTAGYTHLRSPSDVIVTAAQTYEMVNVPENARILNPACLKTGGARKNSKNTRKNRKNSRKNRKTSRKNRKNRK